MNALPLLMLLGQLPAKAVAATPAAAPAELTRTDIFNNYISVFFVSFITTLLVTPLMRRLAIANGIIDRPDETHKGHRFPIAYLGGIGVYMGLLVGIAFSYAAGFFGLINFHNVVAEHLDQSTGLPPGVPLTILLGMTIITIIGLWDDVAKISPVRKVGGQLIAAGALAFEHVGTNVAKQVLTPVATFAAEHHWIASADHFVLEWPSIQISWLPAGHPTLDVVYWTGVVIIALFVLGACNASNLIDGLDGLLSGVTAIAALGLLIIAVNMAMADDGPLDAARIILCMALLGACMGFVPHNFNPASIFLGDSGSLLLGYTTIVIVLSLGDTGQTNLVLAGLIVYALPIVDTTLAIVRRKVSGQAISAADDQHLHHILKRKFGVRGAVTLLYLMGAGFGVLGIALTMGRARLVYAIVLVFAAYIGVIAIKAARRKQFEDQAAKLAGAGLAPARPVAIAPAEPAPAAPAKREVAPAVKTHA